MSYANSTDNRSTSQNPELARAFRDKLKKKQVKDAQRSYFERDNYLNTLNLEIVKEDGTRLIPYRNKECKQAYCIYDVEEVVSKYVNCGFMEEYEFNCDFCEELIKLKHFYYDYTLGEGIKAVWNQYNKQDIVVKEIAQEKNGDVEPVGIDYDNPQPVSEEEGMRSGKRAVLVPKEVLDTELDRHRKPIIEFEEKLNEPRQSLDESFMYDLIPELSEFNMKELSTYLVDLSKSRDGLEKMISPYNIPITKHELENLGNDANVSSNCMGSFLKFIKNYNLINKPEKDREDLILAFNVERFEKYNKILYYKFLKQFKNNYSENLKQTDKRRLILVFKFDERWILAIHSLSKKKSFIIDFLSEDLSKAGREEIYSCVKAFLDQEFRLKPASVSFYEKTKSLTYSDCGLHLFQFLIYHYFQDLDPTKISVDEYERKALGSVVQWILLKVSQAKSIKNDPNRSSLMKFTYYNSESGSPDKISKLTAYAPRKNISSTPLITSKYMQDKITENPSVMRSSELLLKSVPEFHGEGHRKSRLSLNNVLEDIKQDLPQQNTRADSMPNDITKIQDKYSKELNESINRGDVKSLAKKLDRLSEQRKNLQEQQPINYQEYMNRYNNYVQDATKFYQMLTYFQGNNPLLYQRIAEEIQDKIEDTFLDQYGMTHLKYPEVKMNRNDQNNLLKVKNSLFHNKSQKDIAIEDINLPAFRKKLPPIDFSIPTFNLSKENPSKNILKLKESPHPKSTKKIQAPFNLVAQRYGIKIETEDITDLSKRNRLSHRLVNFYLSFLREKQAYLLKKGESPFKTKILYFGPDFYSYLLDPDNQESINYEKVKNWTVKYNAEDGTIFQKFNAEVFVGEIGIGQWAAIYVDNEDKKAYLFDPLRVKEKSPINNLFLYKISQYIQREHLEKTEKRFPIENWQFMFGDVMTADQSSMSALIVLRLVYNFSNGLIKGHFTEEDLIHFKSKVIQLIEDVGITQNKSGELGDIEKMII